jgi:hypothetical protein
LNSNENVWSARKVLESKSGGAVVLVTVWGTSSALTQVTVVPAVTMSSFGSKTELAMDTFTGNGPVFWADGASVPPCRACGVPASVAALLIETPHTVRPIRATIPVT